MKSSCNISVIQMKVEATKEESLTSAIRKIEKAAASGADFAVLPEMFSCPYETSNFPLYAEKEDGKSTAALSEAARKNNIYLIGGSIPELSDDGKVYNTSFVFDRDGKQIAKHRKVHLFDIDITGGQHFRESDTLTAGDQITVFPTEFGNMGLCICYDIRFPEIFRVMADKGAILVFCPAAFNRTTGPKHWDLLFCSRAVDNQIFMVGAAPAADETASYISYGHSVIVSPWGEILGEEGEGEGILSRTIDLSEIEKVREQLPLLLHRRKELYQ